MTHAPPMLPWPKRVSARVLAPARGVGFWRRSVSGEARRAGRILRFGAWVRELTAAPPALLTEEPLGTLAVGLDRPAASEEPKRRHASRRVDGKGTSTGGASNRHRDGTRTAAHRRATAMLVPEGPTSVTSTAVGLPRAARLRRPLPPPGTSAKPRSAALALGAPTVDATRPAVGALLVDRAVRRLLAAAPADVDAAARRDRSAPPVHAAGAARAALSFGDTAAAITAQWSATVSGRAAPRDLLLRLSDVRRVAPDRPDTATEERLRSPAPSAAETPRDAAGRPKHDAWTPREESARSLLGESGADRRARSAARRELFRPPLTRTSVENPPDPLAAVSTDVPAKELEPASEAAARLGLTSAEAGSHGDELAVLAGKVKRILDDEARRHGIDV